MSPIHFVRYVSTLSIMAVVLTGTVAKPRAIESLPRPVSMISSYYGPGFDGRSTASGSRFDRRGLTAAHRTLPFGTRLILTNPKNKKTVTVEVTDRGPYNEFNGVRYFFGRRDLDVSEAAAYKLGFDQEGVATLLVQFVPASVRERAP